jgi:hypothetical protein
MSRNLTTKELWSSSIDRHQMRRFFPEDEDSIESPKVVFLNKNRTVFYMKGGRLVTSRNIKLVASGYLRVPFVGTEGVMAKLYCSRTGLWVREFSRRTIVKVGR